MDLKSFGLLCLEVIKDWRVLVALGGFLIFSMLANYVVKYKKKPPKAKVVKVKKPKPEPKKTEDDEDEDNPDNGDEE